jgi:hypothetical protein
MVVDLFLVYQFVRRLATPFEKWDAFKLGVIDKNGNILIKKKERDAKQKKAWGVFDVMVRNMKRLLAKLPGGSSKLASYAAALFLIKEYKHFSDDSLLNEDITDEQLKESLLVFNDRYVNYIKEDANVKALNEEVETLFEHINTKPELEEEPAANSVGAGGIAGMDAGHMSKAAQAKWTKSNKSKKKKLRDIMGAPTK